MEHAEEQAHQSDTQEAQADEQTDAQDSQLDE